jgi:hypothetical protein
MPPEEPPKTGYAFFKSISPRGRILLGVLGMTFSVLGMYLTDSHVNAKQQAEAMRELQRREAQR